MSGKIQGSGGSGFPSGRGFGGIGGGNRHRRQAQAGRSRCMWGTLPIVIGPGRLKAEGHGQIQVSDRRSRSTPPRVEPAGRCTGPIVMNGQNVDTALVSAHTRTGELLPFDRDQYSGIRSRVSTWLTLYTYPQVTIQVGLKGVSRPAKPPLQQTSPGADGMSARPLRARANRKWAHGSAHAGTGALQPELELGPTLRNPNRSSGDVGSAGERFDELHCSPCPAVVRFNRPEQISHHR